MTLPLDGIRVAEFGNLIAAPYCGMLLADMGAEVTKIEPPGGDLGRTFGPYLDGHSTFFLAVNRGKQSITVDFKTEEGRAEAFEIATNADVVINNLRPGVMERLGLGEESVWAVSPGIVYGVASAFGADGPYADRAGIDIVFQAESGMMSITGESGSAPGKTATTVGDYTAATNLAFGIAAALVERARTGRGRRVDVSLRNSLMAIQGGWNALAFASDAQPPRTGTASPYLAPNQAFKTSDGYVTIAPVSHRHWENLCEALRIDGLNERYPTNEIRMERKTELIAEISGVMKTRTTEEWISDFGPAGIPVGRVRTLPEVWTDPQVIHDEMVVEFSQPTPFRAIGSPIKIDGRPARSVIPPPELGG